MFEILLLSARTETVISISPCSTTVPAYTVIPEDFSLGIDSPVSDASFRAQRNAAKEDWLKNHTYYKHIGLYAYRVEVLKEITALPQSSLEIAESLEQLRWLENGYTIKAGITDVETIGIDTPQDLERAEEFLKSHGL